MCIRTRTSTIARTDTLQLVRNILSWNIDQEIYWTHFEELPPSYPKGLITNHVRDVVEPQIRSDQRGSRVSNRRRQEL